MTQQERFMQKIYSAVNQAQSMHNYSKSLDTAFDTITQFDDAILKAVDEYKYLLPEDLILRQDGNMWMCVHGDFENLQESPSWWGETPELALAAYRTETK